MKESIEQQIAAAKHCMGCMHEGFIFMEERLVQSERLATIGRFASQIAHEIRNPLSSISLNVELLEDEVKESNEEARGLIRSVLKELDRLNDIVSEYLQFSRFPKPHLKRGSAESVVREFVE